MEEGAAKEPTVSIGIVIWNSELDLAGCLEGVEAQRWPSVELIVVDNGSTDGSVRWVEKRAPRAVLLRNSTNLGYCHAHNQAISRSHGEFYLALNPDVKLGPGYLKRMVEVMRERPDCGSAVGKLWLSSDDDPRRIDSTGLFLDRRRHQFLRGHGQPDHGQFDRAGEIFGVDGAAGFHRRSMLEDAAFEGEYFDEQFFTYMEDVDLAWRARLLGWKSWYDPAAQAVHKRRFQPGARSNIDRTIRRIAVKNRFLMVLKNEGRQEWRRDWWRIRLYDLGIWAYVFLAEWSSVGAWSLYRQQRARARAWRAGMGKRVRAGPEERLRWFVEPDQVAEWPVG
jgi:GT2 family glycosyltransferase